MKPELKKNPEPAVGSSRLVMLRAAEIAEKMGDNVGQDKPQTGELSEHDANRAEGCYQVAERLRVEAEMMEQHNQ